MITSMTGFGASQVQSKDVELEVSIKSLNGRFLEMRCHLPREHAGFEREIKKILTDNLIRGTVDVYVNRRATGQAGVDLRVNHEAARRYLKACRELAKKLGLKFEMKMNELVAQPEILVWRPAKMHSNEKALLLKGVMAAVKTLSEERKREGRAVEKHLNALLNQLLDAVARMAKLAESAHKELSVKLRERLNRSGAAEKFDSTRLNQELALYLDRADVAEEIQRLREHLHQCQELVKSPGHPGKKLDFYTQELHREVNTIGSKSPLPALTQLVVQSKAWIEQLKEQVQNIV